jgi:acetoin utilization deacetylase AcuC-like enzyme
MPSRSVRIVAATPASAQTISVREVRRELRPTGLLYDDIYLKHLSGNSGHPERPERLTAIWNGLQKADLIHDMYRLAPRRATDNELALVHERSYIQLVRRELAHVRGTKS